MTEIKIDACPACGSPAAMDLANACEGFATKGLSSFTLSLGPFRVGVVDSSRWSAAERLARRVLEMHRELPMPQDVVAEARKVLGEKP